MRAFLQLSLALALCALLAPSHVTANSYKLFQRSAASASPISLRSVSRRENVPAEGRFTTSIMNKFGKDNRYDVNVDDEDDELGDEVGARDFDENDDGFDNHDDEFLDDNDLEKAPGAPNTMVRRPTEKEWQQFQVDQRNRRRLQKLQREHNKRVRALIRRQLRARQDGEKRYRQLQRRSKRRLSRRNHRNRSRGRRVRGRRRRVTKSQRRRRRNRRQRRRQTRRQRRRIRRIMRRRRRRGGRRI
ncbi:stress response protein NST1-like [Scaptodrosophila lebanonensis]|uniref:Stress response protein NST1-like n=1 Tax=Drosophila lebanonensis TaxID=7225 RepID=A0A6J2UEV1_DROLE|nr:stress response protein NST1-like [Scaptodrosophila lebanonensis]